jgi:hypothetical protein
MPDLPLSIDVPHARTYRAKCIELRCVLIIGLSIFAVGSLTGCSMKAWYGGVKFAAENDCRRQPPSEIDGCLARLNTMTYEQYERKRSGQNQ